MAIRVNQVRISATAAAVVLASSLFAGTAHSADVSVRIVAIVPTICVADYVPSPLQGLIGPSRIGSVRTFCNSVGGYSLRIVDAAQSPLVYDFSALQGIRRVSGNYFVVNPLQQLDTDLLATGTNDAGAVAQSVRIEIVPQA